MTTNELRQRYLDFFKSNGHLINYGKGFHNKRLRKFDYEHMCLEIKEGHNRGKISWVIVVAEGAGKAHEVANTITTMTGLETRFVVLGHVQRGGVPTGQDRIIATRLGAAAVDLIAKGIYGKAVGVLQDEINIIDIKEATQKEFKHLDTFYRLVKLLT